jgi:hypothetical protein
MSSKKNVTVILKADTKKEFLEFVSGIVSEVTAEQVFPGATDKRKSTIWVLRMPALDVDMVVAVLKQSPLVETAYRTPDRSAKR